MTNPERAQQLWSLLILAARNQQILSYTMVEKMIGIPDFGLGQTLGPIDRYCRLHKLPILNSLVISEKTGRPSPDFFDGVDIPAEQSRVFVFDWLSHRIPSPEELEEARREARAV